MISVGCIGIDCQPQGGDGATMDAPLTSTGIADGTGPLTYSCASTVWEQDDTGKYVPWAANVRPWNSTKGTTVNPAATNLITQSQLASGWTVEKATITDSGIAGIIQGLNKRLLKEDSAAGAHDCFFGVSKAASALQYTFYAIVEAAGRDKIRLYLTDATFANGVYAQFTLTGDGSILTAPTALGTGWTIGYAQILPEGGGRYRCVLSATSGTTTSIYPTVYLHNGTSTSYTGDGTSGVYIHHAQLEQSAYHTSPIPTSGSTATRSAATCTIPAANFGADNYVIYCEGTFTQDPNTGSFRLMGWGLTASTPQGLEFISVVTGFVRTSGTHSSVGRTACTSTVPASGLVRIACVYTGGNTYFFANGTKSTTVATTPVDGASAPNSLGNSFVGSAVSPAAVRNVRIYPVLTDSELQRLTTTGSY